ncbi:hypothetical protein DR66_4034 [Delftia acidovorans]|uniref:DUF2190 family protein n=1 Tax=Delftia acidovorans TaxID=80866 RepID=UPI0005072AE7|nr:DUF2190 family protein [Delftia acidovorans]KFJ12817.1 hypothetical protein DR66_4034 [Delftia acidovorans]QQB53375.1 DUF2190 family protein [Delftia acidovorans]
MANNHIAPGRVMDYVNTGAEIVNSGDVVVSGSTLGVALVNIAPGATGSVAVDGVFRVPKVAGAAIGQGVALVFKKASQAFSVGATAAGDVSGPAAVAWASAAQAAEWVDVKFTGVPGTVAA